MNGASTIGMGGHRRHHGRQPAVGGQPGRQGLRRRRGHLLLGERRQPGVRHRLRLPHPQRPDDRREPRERGRRHGHGGNWSGSTVAGGTPTASALPAAGLYNAVTPTTAALSAGGRETNPVDLRSGRWPTPPAPPARRSPTTTAAPSRPVRSRAPHWYPTFAAGTATGQGQAAWSVTRQRRLRRLRRRVPERQRRRRSRGSCASPCRRRAEQAGPAVLHRARADADARPGAGHRPRRVAGGLGPRQPPAHLRGAPGRHDRTSTVIATRTRLLLLEPPADGLHRHGRRPRARPRPTGCGSRPARQHGRELGDGAMTVPTAPRRPAPTRMRSRRTPRRTTGDSARATGTVGYDWASAERPDAGPGTRHGVARRDRRGRRPGERRSAGRRPCRAVSAISQPGPQTLLGRGVVQDHVDAGGKIVGFGNSATGQQQQLRPARLHGQRRPADLRRVQRRGPDGPSSRGYNDGGWHHVVGTLGPSGDDALRRRQEGRADAPARHRGQPYTGTGGSAATTSTAGRASRRAATSPGPSTTSRSTRRRCRRAGRRPTTPPGGSAVNVPAARRRLRRGGLRRRARLYWRLDETSGTTAVDTIAADTGATYTGGALGQAPCRARPGGQRRSPSRRRRHVRRPAASTTNPHGLTRAEAWFKTTTTTGGQIIGFGDAKSGPRSNYDRHVYMLDDGQLRFGIWTGQANTITRRPPTTTALAPRRRHARSPAA